MYRLRHIHSVRLRAVPVQHTQPLSRVLFLRRNRVTNNAINFVNTRATWKSQRPSKMATFGIDNQRRWCCTNRAAQMLYAVLLAAPIQLDRRRAMGVADAALQQPTVLFQNFPPPSLSRTYAEPNIQPSVSLHPRLNAAQHGKLQGAHQPTPRSLPRPQPPENNAEPQLLHRGRRRFKSSNPTSSFMVQYGAPRTATTLQFMTLCAATCLLHGPTTECVFVKVRPVFSLVLSSKFSYGGIQHHIALASVGLL